MGGIIEIMGTALAIKLSYDDNIQLDSPTLHADSLAS
jgi:hypothetical protein